MGVDEVDYDDSYYRIVFAAVANGAHTSAWAEPRPGASVARAAAFMLFAQVEPGHACSISVTEKQGGSYVRANTTVATDAGDDSYRLTGHKWFCSAPKSDAFLALTLQASLMLRFTPSAAAETFIAARLDDDRTSLWGSLLDSANGGRFRTRPLR